MKKMFLASAFSVCTLMAIAQPGPEHQHKTPEQIAQRQANNLSERLLLTETQRAKAYAVYLDNAKKREEVMTARRKQMEKERKQDEEVAKQEDTKIEQVLTTDQKKTFQAFANRHESRFEQHSFRMDGRRFAGRFPDEQNQPEKRFGRFAEQDKNFDGPENFNRMPDREGKNYAPDMNRMNKRPGQNPADDDKLPHFKPMPGTENMAPDSSRTTRPKAN